MSFTYRGLKADFNRHMITEAEVDQQVLRMQQQNPRITVRELAQALSFSPIKGPEGNIEFLARLAKGKPSVEIDVAAIVDEAHEIAK